jgi:hypothetical protein
VTWAYGPRTLMVLFDVAVERWDMQVAGGEAHLGKGMLSNRATAFSTARAGEVTRGEDKGRTSCLIDDEARRMGIRSSRTSPRYTARNRAARHPLLMSRAPTSFKSSSAYKRPLHATRAHRQCRTRITTGVPDCAPISLHAEWSREPSHAHWPQLDACPWSESPLGEVAARRSRSPRRR